MAELEEIKLAIIETNRQLKLAQDSDQKDRDLILLYVNALVEQQHTMNLLLEAQHGRIIWFDLILRLRQVIHFFLLVMLLMS